VNALAPDLPLTILAAATAIGLSPYAALATMGWLAYIGAVALPPVLLGLAKPLLWGTLIGLTVIDGFLSRFRLTDLVWNVMHTIARPVAAFLFAGAALAAVQPAGQWMGSLTAFLIALLVHVSVLAVRTATRTAGPMSWFPGLTTVRLLCAALLAGFAFTAPPLAAAAAAVLLIAPLPWSPRLWGAAALAVASVLHALTRPDRTHNWIVGVDRLPRALRETARAALGRPSGPVRHARATLARLGPAWPYWRGRIIVEADKPVVFLHQRGFQPRAIPLQAASARNDEGLLIETLEVEDPIPFALCLGPDAPAAPAILTALKRSPAPQ
jgi:hypothetical protein